MFPGRECFADRPTIPDKVKSARKPVCISLALLRFSRRIIWILLQAGIGKRVKTRRMVQDDISLIHKMPMRRKLPQSLNDRIQFSLVICLM